MNITNILSFPLCKTNDFNNYSCISIVDEHLGLKGICVVALLCIFEYLVLWYKSKPLPPPHENILSLAHAIFGQLIRIWIRFVEFIAYIWLWKRYAIFATFFSTSLTSHLGTVVLIDFCYYWFHRMSHEVMLFWAIHQVHHSSIDMTVPVGLRHSPLQYLFSWVFYLPLAVIGVPVSHLVVHLQLNLLYQTWIHTEVVDNLGPLECVFNTPSHHRVHHGILKHEIDKNFGGVFIIWDYLFGTFEKESKKEEKIYGIIYQPEKLNIGYQQIFYIKRMIAKAKTMSTKMDFFHTFWKGPSWQPGSSRTGRELETIYDYYLNQTRQKANTSNFINSYICLHLIASLLLLSKMTSKMGANIFSFAIYSILILAALTNVGIIYEGRPLAITIELYRCIAGFVFCLIFPITNGIIHQYVLYLFGVSIVIWIMLNCQNKVFNHRENKENAKTE